MAFIIAPNALSLRRNAPFNKSCNNIRPPSVRRVACMAAFKAREVSDIELERAVSASERPMVIDAYAKWCGPCQILAPELNTVAEQYGDRIDVLKLDTDAYPKMASALAVRGLPTLFFIKNGELRYRMEGALKAEQLTQCIETILFDSPPPQAA